MIGRRNIARAALVSAFTLLGACADDVGSEAADAASQHAVSCGELACAPLGVCDTTVGVCACGPSAFFDGFGCAPMPDCEADRCACTLPRAPVLPSLPASEVLGFSVDGELAAIDVAIVEDLERSEPDSWTREDSVALAGLAGREVRVFARVAEAACDAPIFHAVVRVADAFPASAGAEGSDAVASDDVRIAAWATRVERYEPGEAVDLEWTDETRALGPAGAATADVVALGRGGAISVGFDVLIADGPGADFAVFENGFADDFLELAFVEVSSDGATWVRFDSAALDPAPVDAYGTIDASRYGQLAGRYRAGFGTPFDLAVLRQHDAVVRGALDLRAVRYVRVVDVVGDGSALDSWGRLIRDPWPTTGSAGFDLDGVAVLNALAP